jgi:hypothetical protein
LAVRAVLRDAARMIVALVLAAVASQSPPLSASVANVTVIGLSEEQDAATKAKIDEELAALGATVFPGPVVEADCVPDPSCLQSAMKDAGAEVWLYFEAIRVGPTVQISSTLYDNKATEIATGKMQADPDAFPGQSDVLPSEVRAKLTEMAAARAPQAPPDTVELKSTEPKQPPKVGSGKGMGMLQTAGLFVGGVGVVAAGVGTIIAIEEALVLENAASLRDDKDRARMLAWVGIGVGALGLAAAGGGAGMFFLTGE